MTVIDELFERTRAENRAALVGYLPAGFPTVDASIAAIQAMVEGGVDLVEVGLPYSDPVMDGPTIQAAAEAALVNGTRVDDVFRVVAASAATGAPTVVMTYWNPVERRGVDRFAADLAAAGGAGLITPDLIPDEGTEWERASRAHGLDRVYLVSPSSTDDRLAMTADAASGFIYATAVMGVTGQREQTSSLAPELVARLRKVTDKPVGVGLGVSNGAQAHEIAEFADAVIVGSALVRCLLDQPDEASALTSLRELAAELRAGVERD
ncbi:tryptophan synthase subunit alpha [Aeromicrobium duanguangcaii]|uniref:Tryptophan synthase alpha chain n=1 Tax=Aeromicrobium duanguangcaii TaxID=2968086 RepID=A0ABY5KIS0_9ACTN|nr:tryptophan synthase subunit alpha [Aeromicrobium duanguangcaii]MCD9153216.1 tryptophan synthase subunit alpha [Aeromicrobium duanguangcaii]UUI69684.1 tryptophan synthase subunit alpha [Aeromicrobium duanguangcaii]